MKTVISFGTDGWRSTMDSDFTVQNLSIAAQGIADYLQKQGYNKKGIIIGYDTRKNSQVFAEEVAKVLLGNGIKVLLTDTDTPIPVVTFGILDKDLDGGVMITASHNPPEYNGIKFIPYYASPALPDITEPIMDEIKKNWENPSIKKQAIEDGKKNNKFEYVNLKQDYITSVMSKINSGIITDAKLKIVFDALYGTARDYLPEILRKIGVEVEVLHDTLDPNFGGASPNPSEKNLAEVSELIVKNNYDLGLACDGDADRMGVLDDKGKFIHANILFALLFNYEISQGKPGDVVRTVGTSHLIDRIARTHNRTIFETPVGAKYIGQYMREKGLLLGGEESGGMIFRGHIAEKDGIFANLKILEMVATFNKPLSKITAELFEKYGNITFTLINYPCADENKPKVMENIVKILPNTVSGKKVVKKTELDGFKFVLEDDSWLLIRPSGTEPLLRLYGESTDEKELAKILDEGKKLLEQALK